MASGAIDEMLDRGNASGMQLMGAGKRVISQHALAMADGNGQVQQDKTMYTSQWQDSSILYRGYTDIRPPTCFCYRSDQANRPIPLR
jgi:hypothetical protein